MITVPGKFHFVFSPHAASRSIRAALLQIPGAFQPGQRHHCPPNEIPRDGLAVYAMTRNPFDWVCSYYGKFSGINVGIGFEEFLWKHTSYIGRPWVRGRLNVYDGFVDRYLMLEDGVDLGLHLLGYDEISVPHIGKGPHRQPKDFNPGVAMMIANCFERDIEIYRGV